MRREKPFSLEDHVAAGNGLKTAKDTTAALLVAVSRSYGKTHKATRAAMKAHQVLTKPQSELDNIACKEIPESVDKKFAMQVYYGPALVRKGVTDERKPSSSFAPSSVKRGAGPNQGSKEWLLDTYLP